MLKKDKRLFFRTFWVDELSPQTCADLWSGSDKDSSAWSLLRRDSDLIFRLEAKKLLTKLTLSLEGLCLQGVS